MHKKAKPILYQKESINQGISYNDQSSLYYGVNGNRSHPANEDIESTIFHEFGHNLWASDTNFGKHIVNYNTNLLSGSNAPNKNSLPDVAR